MTKHQLLQQWPWINILSAFRVVLRYWASKLDVLANTSNTVILRPRSLSTYPTLFPHLYHGLNTVLSRPTAYPKSISPDLLHNEPLLLQFWHLPRTCPTIMRPSSPATADRAFLSLAYCTKAKPLCTEQPTILPYLQKMASTSAFVTSSVLRFPMKTREFSERGSVLLVTLLAMRLLVVGDRLRGGGRGEGGGREQKENQERKG